MKKNWLTIGIVIATVVLGGVAVVTAFRLYQIGQEPIAPTAPSSSLADTLSNRGGAPGTLNPSPKCQTSFTVTAAPGCYEGCTTDTDCPSEPIDLKCQTVDDLKRCVNPDCPERANCQCPVACYEQCATKSDCLDEELDCQDIDGTYRCVNPSCNQEVDCECPPSQLSCWDQCTNGDDCGDYKCQDVNGVNRCVNPSCDQETDCQCPPSEVGCWDECSGDTDCSGSLRCQTTDGVKRCLNPDCSSETDCQCPGPTKTPTPKPTVTPTPPPGATSTLTPTPQPELPEAGLNLPTFGVVAAGFLLILFGLLLAL